MPGYMWDYYEPSPLMSTYLVAFLVSEYAVVPSNSSLSPNIEVNVWARPDAKELTR